MDNMTLSHHHPMAVKNSRISAYICTYYADIMDMGKDDLQTQTGVTYSE
jgi:hypothetical protein